jgi:hypothetical protein
LQKISLNTYVSFIGFLRLGFYTENSFALLDARVSELDGEAKVYAPARAAFGKRSKS